MSVEPVSLTHPVRVQIFEALRLGVVPDIGLEAYADLDPRVDSALQHTIDAPSGAGGALRFVRGDLGTGKTFSLKLAAARARDAGYVTTIATLNEQTTTLHSAERLFRAWMAGLRTSDAGGGLLDLVDRWVHAVHETLRSSDTTREPGADALFAALEHDLLRRNIGADFGEFRTTLLALARARYADDRETTWGLVSWLSGSDNVSTLVLRRTGVRGRIHSDDVEHVLADLGGLVAAAGYRGILFGLDELASILRCEREQREKSWEALLRIVDQWRNWPHTAWMFSATNEVFDSPRGVPSFEALHQRISRITLEGVDSGRQAQTVLSAMDEDRLVRIAQKLLPLYPTTDRVRLAPLESEGAIRSVIARIQTQPGAPVQPRRFFRAFCEVLDALDNGTLTSLDTFRPTAEPVDTVAPLPTAEVRW